MSTINTDTDTDTDTQTHRHTDTQTHNSPKAAVAGIPPTIPHTRLAKLTPNTSFPWFMVVPVIPSAILPEIKVSNTATNITDIEAVKIPPNASAVPYSERHCAGETMAGSNTP